MSDEGSDLVHECMFQSLISPTRSVYVDRCLQLEGMFSYPNIVSQNISSMRIGKNK